MRLSVVDRTSVGSRPGHEFLARIGVGRLTGEDAETKTDFRKPTKGKLVEIKEKASAPLTHEDLALRVARSRDRAAYKELFYYFGPRVKAHLLKFGLDNQRAEDLTQDVMVKVWQKAEQFDPAKAKFSTWVFRIARNKFIDHTRKRKYPEVNADDHLGQMIAPEETDKPVEEKQTAKFVEAAITKLKPEQQQVIKLSFFEEMSHSEIAAHLSLPLGTVKSRIRIAFQTLRGELGDRP